MDKENGNISIHTENIFPIIKRWLYSDKDIFVRELISNGCDAISKFKRIVSMGEAEVAEDTKYSVNVSFNKDQKIIKFIDNGIGMTAEEVKKYINQVAFSGAEEFLSKYKDKIDEQNQIIGHFGLGFYSAFMVSEKVQIDTLSYLPGAEAVKWTCTGGTEFQIEPSELTTRGTVITLTLQKEDEELADEFKLREIITKHCAFLPIEIYLENEVKEEKKVENEVKEEKKVENEVKEEKKVEDKDEKKIEEDKVKEENKPLNDIHPLWVKSPNDCTDEEYKEFYKKVFNDYNEPLFWIHLNVDYPFNLKGILYFPKLKHELDASEGQIKLYNNQVFVADNIKEVIPEFLLLLKGVIDCSDLPLNVSRSFLQKDANVIKISKHISKKVADKLTGLYKTEKEKYEGFWNDINPFIKYGCMRDESFYEQVKDVIIFKSINGEYITLKEYLDKAKDKHENKVFYVNDETQQSQYIKLFKDNGIDAIILNSNIDNHFISFLEYKKQEVKFNRIDSDISDTLKNKDEVVEENKEQKELKEKVEKQLVDLFKDTVGDDKLIIKVESLKTTEVPAIMLLSEQSRRMQEMSSMFGGMDMGAFPKEETLVINTNNKLIEELIKLKDSENKKEDVHLICGHVYDLAVMSYKQLSADNMAKFISRSNELLSRLAEI